LLGTIDGFSGAPTSKQMSDIDDCAAQLQKAMPLVNQLFDDFPKMNKTLADAGLPYFNVDTANVPAATFGRGGGPR
jgi:hypothetical protein